MNPRDISGCSQNHSSIHKTTKIGENLGRVSLFPSLLESKEEISSHDFH